MFKLFSRRSAIALEREANRIADPLERLRFLRQRAPVKVGAPLSESPLPGRRYFLALVALIACGLAALALVRNRASASPDPVRPSLSKVEIPSAGPGPDQVWLVESSETHEIYSNGLHVDLSFATGSRPRREYPVFTPVGDSTPIAMGREPRGLVFHTTESDVAPFEESANQKIEWLSHQLLQFVRREHSYHYLIDRYGRVYRVVKESNVANHAGYSVWGDHRGVYVNLNESFLGVAFEGKTGQRDDVTAAQVSAARMLTELLRSRYSILPEDCVTHAQVSVAPWNMRIANHMDWARGFPWASLGLPENYNLPVPSVAVFGFTHDQSLTQALGGNDWSGLTAADGMIMKGAAAQSATPTRYRGMLRHRYQEIVTELRRQQQALKEPVDPLVASGLSDIGEI